MAMLVEESARAELRPLLFVFDADFEMDGEHTQTPSATDDEVDWSSFWATYAETME